MQLSDDARLPVSRLAGRRRWRHLLSLSMVALLLVSMLAACGGGDDDDDTTPTTGASGATATTAPAGDTASPTTAVEPTSTTAPPPSPTATTAPASPTAQGTAPPRPIATQPSAAPTATTGNGSDAAAIEDAMISVLITDADLGTGWTQDELGPDPEGDDNGANICDIGDFPDKDAKIAQVESQVNYDDGTVGGLYAENLTAFPLDIAESAFDYAVEGAACGTWIDGDGNEHVLTAVEAPGLGDESAAYAWTFTTQGQELTGYYAFVRVGPFVALFGWLGLPALDDDAMVLITAEAVDRISTLATALGSGGTAPAGDLQAQVVNALLTAAQLDTIMPSWTDLGPAEITFTDRYSVCQVVSFAERFDVRAEAAAEYELDGEFTGSLQHGLVVMADGEGTTVFEQIRADAQCGTWADSGTTITLEQQTDPAVGDETLLLMLSVSDSSGASGYAAIAYTRWQDVISIVSAISIDPIDPLFLEAAQQQVELNIAAS